MRGSKGSYLANTRHPWACVLFVLPLLLLYEIGLYSLGPTPPDDARNGADTWLRGLLQQFGMSPLYGAPVVLAVALIAWTVLRRRDRPRDFLGLWIGMTTESALYAIGLLCLAQFVFPALQALGGVLDPVFRRGIHTAVVTTASVDPRWQHLIGFVGAGIYEETLFRLLAYSGLATLALMAGLPRGWSVILAGLASALLFAGAHNLGPGGEPFQTTIFLFRTGAGLYFTLVYQLRGFGIAVGAHATYDVCVGLLAQSA